MVNVQKNHFYRKTVIPTTGAAKLHALYKDLPLNESSTWTFKGASEANKFVVSGSVPSDPPYKQGELDYARLVMTCSGTDLSKTARLPNVTMYKLKSNMEMTEGGAGINTNGENMVVYSSIPDTDNLYKEENFDGSDKSLGIAVTTDTVGGGLRQLENAYGDPDDLAQAIYVGGTFSIFHSGEEIEGGTGTFLSRYFGQFNETTGKYRIFLKPVISSKPSGKWTVKIDKRKDMEKYLVFKPIWRWNDIKGLVEYEKTVSKGGDTEENTVPVSENNTIFQKIGMTPDNQNIVTENVDGTPWILSAIELSQERAAVGGQSLKLSHLWNSTEGTSDSQNIYGPSTAINPQFTTCVTEDIPFPIPLDQAFAGAGPTIADVSGSSVLAPELNMKVNIAELGQTLELSTATSYPGQMKDPISKRNVYLGRSATAAHTENSLSFKTLLRSFCVTFSNYLPEENESMDTFVRRGLNDFYCGTDLKDNTLTNNTVGSGNTEHSSTKNRKIVGGISFTRRLNVNAVTSTQASAAATVNAMPLLTRMSPYAYKFASRNRMMVFSSGTAGSTLANRDADILCQGATVAFPSGTSTSGATADRMKTLSDFEPIVPVSMDKFFNMKFVWNMNGRNKGHQIHVSGCSINNTTTLTLPSAAATAGLTTGMLVIVRTTGGSTNQRHIDSIGTNTVTLNLATGLGTHADAEVIFQGDTAADLMRVHFTDTVVESTRMVGGSQVAGLENAENAPPSLPIYFPVAPFPKAISAPQAGNQDWSWAEFPQYWPRYMTIWLNNYRFIPTTEKKWGEGSGGNGIIQNDFPTASGARQATVYVDSINMKYFAPEVTNHSAGASSFSKPLSIKKSVHTSFMASGAAHSGSTEVLPDTANPRPNIQSGFATRVNSAGEPLSQFTLPTYVCMGFDNKADAFYDSSGDYVGALMFNGFASPSINNLTRNTEFTTKAWASTVSGNFTDLTAAQQGQINSSVGRFGYDMFGAKYSSAHTSNNGSVILPAFRTQGTVVRTKLEGSTDDEPFAICLASGNEGTGTRSTDAFTSKGALQIAAEAGTANQYSTGLINNWVKRENPLASVKVLSAKSMDTNDPNYNNQFSTILVDNVEIFREKNYGDTEYVLYIAGASATAAQVTGTATVQNSTAGYNWSGSFKEIAAITQRSEVVKQTKPPTVIGNKFAIHLNRPVQLMYPTEVVPYVYISPFKYWLNFEVYPGNVSTEDIANGAVLKGTETDSKVYDTIVPLSAIPSSTTLTGSTFNELTYGYNSTGGLAAGRHGLYSKPWVLEPAEKLETSLELTVDYGYGAFDPETLLGGEVDVKPAQTGLLTELDFSKIAKKLKPEQPLLMVMNLYKATSDQSATFYGNDYTTNTAYKPYYLFGYHDEVPKVDSFSVGPAVEDILDKNLYELTTENLNAVKFNFDISGDDIWYKYMIINDSGSVQDKYDQAFLWAPLNEPINTDLSQPSFRAYSPNGSFDDASTTLTNNNSVISDIEGLAGYAAKFNGNNSNLVLANSVESKPVSEEKFSFVAHAIPASGMTGANYIYSKGNGESQGLWIYVSGSTSRNQKVYVRQRNTHLVGKSTVICDGETPLSVIYTYESGSADGNAGKLYVNGALEDLGNPGLVSDTANHRIGCEDDAGDAFDGHIEELIFYETVLKVVDSDNEYLINTRDLNDKIGSEIATNNAKLFAYDYTNIRGRNDNEVASSKNISWRVDAP
jgi:hypothetical protein